MVSGLRKPGGSPQAARVAQLVRDGLRLGADSIVSVAEISCLVPGCPPIETLALIWDKVGTPYRLRFFSEIANVTSQDIPPAWYLPALQYDGEAECGCC